MIDRDQHSPNSYCYPAMAKLFQDTEPDSALRRDRLKAELKNNAKTITCAYGDDKKTAPSVTLVGSDVRILSRGDHPNRPSAGHGEDWIIEGLRKSGKGVQGRLRRASLTVRLPSVPVTARRTSHYPRLGVRAFVLE